MRRSLVLVVSFVGVLWAYPAQYEESLEGSFEADIKAYYVIPEDFRSTRSTDGRMDVVSRSGDTVVIGVKSVYADTLRYRMVKVSPETHTDFDDLEAGGRNVRFYLKIDSVENTGIDLDQYAYEGGGLWLDSLMSSPDYENFSQRLYARGVFDARNDTTEVILDLDTWVPIYHEGWPAPTIRNVRYGPHWERNVFDFWSAETDRPAPVYFYIHGGGWSANEKYRVGWYADNWRSRGFATVSINYRLRSSRIDPPATWPLYDAVRAMQTLRGKAAEFNIDPNRIATAGGSAGGCTSMWLALHDDIADPSNSDPIARFSSKPTVATGLNAQTSLNPYDFIEWPYIGTTNAIFTSDMPPGAYGVSASTWQEKKEGLLAVPRDILDEYSPLTHVSADDVPVYLSNTHGLVNCTPDSCDGGAIHHAQMGVALKEKMDVAGVECVLDIPGESYHNPYGSTRSFIIEKLSEPTDNANTVYVRRMARMNIAFRKTSRGYVVAGLPAGSRLRVFDAAGKQISIADLNGEYRLSPSAQGVYVYSVTYNGTVQRGKLNLTR